jgi:hypothetical protein
MGYIRNNEDAFIDEGYSPEEAEIQARIYEANIDYGYCNPIKAKLAHEQEEEIREQVRRERAKRR